MPPLPVVPAVIELTFSPIVTIGDLDVRLETLALALVILASLLVAARIVHGTPIDLRRPAHALDEDGDPNHLRVDDLLYLAVGALPGAVAGGRLGYVLLHLDYYSANQGAILDIGQGGFQLSLAVVGGTLTAAIVVSLVGGSVGRWLHALALPVLLAIAGGKAAMILGGDGQGVAWNGTWATAYAGPGPWGSLAPDVPSHPAQAYEALATVAILVVLMALLGRAVPAPGRRRLPAGIALWALARTAVAATWRDPGVIGQLRMDQVLSLAIAAGATLLLLAAAIVRSVRRQPAEPPSDATGPDVASRPRPRTGSMPEWPDPASRPRI